MKHDTFAQAYIEAALWSSTDGDGLPLDSGDYELAPETVTRMVEDCKNFQADNEELLDHWYSDCGESDQRAGHDFWLTRCGHGAGFWDRWNSATPQGRIGAELTKACKTFGNVDLYVGDDGLIYSI
jgi:hypothetical protein